MDVSTLLEKTQLFHGATEDDRRAVAPLAAPVPVAPGDAVYQSGSVADALYLIQLGTVEMHAQGGDKILATYGSGQVFGELPFFSPAEVHRRISTAVAREHCNLLRIPYADLERVLAARPSLALVVYRNTALFAVQALRELVPLMQRPYF